MYNSGYMKMESNRLFEWFGLFIIWICMYCILIYKIILYGNYNIKWYVWYIGKVIIFDVIIVVCVSCEFFFILLFIYSK